IPARRRPEIRASGRPAAKDSGTSESRVRRTALTGRAAVLALVVCALVLSFAYPVRQYVEQQSQIARLEAQNERQRAQVDDLEGQKRRWQDPAYVRTQARERLHFVMPGETGFVASGTDARELRRQSGTAPHEAPAENQPWYTRLWTSVEGASGPTGTPEP
ncbi:MAG: FtsB family cell division protein, partial [Actinomycetes bacterium]